MFKKSIKKEEVNSLALAHYTGPVQLIEEATHLGPAINAIRQSTIIGVDTETKPSFRKGQSYPVALLQVATDQHVFLFRLNKIGFPGSLISILEDGDITKIGIDFEDDIKSLQKLRNFQPQSVVDLNAYSKSLGFKNYGARNLTAIVLGFRFSKRQQTSNWEVDVLSEQQIIYAATDAWVCREIYLSFLANGYGP